MKLADALGPFRAELERIEKGEAHVDSPLSKRVIGAEDGVVGLIDAVLEGAGVHAGFDPADIGAMASLERWARNEGSEDLADVLRVSQAVSRMYPDVLGTGYGGTPSDFEAFRRRIVPWLLQTVAAWARHHDDKGSVDALQALEAHWNRIVG